MSPQMFLPRLRPQARQQQAKRQRPRAAPRRRLHQRTASPQALQVLLLLRPPDQHQTAPGHFDPVFPSSAELSEFSSGEDALARIRRLIADGGMTAVVQREQSTTMASMGGFGNNIIVSHRIHRGSQTGSARPPAPPASSSGQLLTPPSGQSGPPLPAASPAHQLSPVWGLSDPQPGAISLEDLDDLFDSGRTDDDALPAPPPSSLLLSSPSSSSSSSSHSPLPGSEAPTASGYPSDAYGR